MSIPTAAAPAFDEEAARTRFRRTLLGAFGLAAQAVAIFFIAYFLLGGRSRDLHSPIKFGVDSTAYLMQSKTTLEQGWWWSNPRLAAPSSLNNLLWPSHSNVDQALIKTVGLVTRELGFTINVTWLLMLALSGVAATYGMQILGVGRLSAVVLGTLFALTPFALYRNLEHFMLVTYLIPFSATLAVVAATGASDTVGRGQRAVLYAGCALTGFNYAYYALFGVMFLAVGIVAGTLGGQPWRRVLPGVMGCVAIVVATGISVRPSYGAWAAEGRPAIIQEKVPAEAEVYGLKIRHLISPVWGQTFAPFEAWNRRDAWARFPLETENTASRLGIVGAIGLLAALGCVLAARARSHATRTGQSAGHMIVAGILVATIGGFGTLFNMFVAADIRAYTRITPFLAFFALLVVALGCDALGRRSRVAGGLLLAVVLAVGLWDQSFPFSGVRAQAAATREDYRQIESFVHDVEAGLPRGSMVLQLPFVLYLNEATGTRTGAYASFKPYLVSQHLRWSYGALSNQQLRWQQAAMKVPERDLPAVMAREGFAAIWIDRLAYDDGGVSTLNALTATPGVDLRWSNDRYAVIDIRKAGPGGAAVLPAIDSGASPSTTTLPACIAAAAPLVAVEYVGGEVGPFGAPVSWRAGRDLRVGGWLVPGDKSGTAFAVDASLDGHYVHVYYGFPRPDVAAAYGGPQYQDAGFVTVVPGALLTPGAHALTFRIASGPGVCASEASAVTLVVR